LPTATGKSVVIADFCKRALYYYPRTRILVLTHVKELIAQNHAKMMLAWPQAPAGIYSAGLKRKETNKQITFAGVQSVHNNVGAFGYIDLILIDECHLVSPEQETRYGEVITALKATNPHLKVAGLSATGWRLKSGMLTNVGLFTDICYDRTRPDDFRRFIAEGFLSPLVTRRTATQIDVSNVSLTNGEFNAKQLEDAANDDTTTHAALRELCHYGQDRRAWVVFCSGVAHAEHCASILNSWGIRTGTVHHKSTDRDETLRDWYSGKLRCVTNNNVLTTGIDYPALDLIGMLRPTMSSSLWVQMLGRGMRPSVPTMKTNCLVLDYAGNTARLGPVDDPSIPGKPKPKGEGEAPVKLCAECSMYNHASVRVCSYCGAEFPTLEKIVANAGDHQLMSSDIPIIETFNVTNCLYFNHVSRKSGDRSLHCMYYSGIRSFSEYVAMESAKPFAKHQSHVWWKQRYPYEDGFVPQNVEEAMGRTSYLRVPTRIKVWVNKGKYPEIVGHEWH
jgi:DNA repair protein RadD